MQTKQKVKMHKEITLFLKQNRNEIINLAIDNLIRNKFDHYVRSEQVQTGNKFNNLMDTIIISVQNNDVNPMIRYMDKIARERYQDSYMLFEVQAAINAVEENIWTILKKKSFAYRLDAFRLISRITGIAKLTLSTHFDEFSHDESLLADPNSIMLNN